LPDNLNKKFNRKEKVIQKKPEEIPVYLQIEKLKGDIKVIARDVAIKTKEESGWIDWNLPHKKWIKLGGKPMEQETIKELLKRKTWLLEQL